MMKVMKKLVVGGWLVAAGLCGTVWAEPAAETDFTFDPETGTITGYNGAGGDVEIPSKIDGIAVTAIGEEVFAGNADLTSVTIPAGVTEIGLAAFASCWNLGSVAFAEGSSLENIDEGAFFECASLAEIMIPAGVTEIGVVAFAGCENLGSVAFAEGGSLETIGEGAFNCCVSLKDITIPASVMGIGPYAFGDCGGLKEITIPAGVTGVGPYAFTGCEGLGSVAFAEGSLLESIDEGAFSGCASLAEITIPTNVMSIGDEAFEGCVSLSSVEFLGSAVAGNIGDWAFSGVGCDEVACTLTLPEDWPSTDLPNWCGSWHEGTFENYISDFWFDPETGTITGYHGSGGDVEIPAQLGGVDVKAIGGAAFAGNADLTSVTIPAGVTEIGLAAFASCECLEFVTFAEGSSLETIGEGAFSGCALLADITIPANVTDIGAEAFNCCISLTEIAIPASVTSIGAGAFVYCESLESVTFAEGSSLETIGEGAFSYCALQTEITIPASVTDIGAGAFGNCQALGGITFAEGSSLTTLGEQVFACCYSLKEITIPAGVTDIGPYAFMECEVLGSVTFADGCQLATIGEGSFNSCSSLADITIPASVMGIGPYAFAYCGGLEAVTFGEGSSLATIGEGTFSGCDSLADITIPASVTSIGAWAFGDCYSLTDVTMLAITPPTAGEDVFSWCEALTAIHVPTWTKAAYVATEGWTPYEDIIVEAPAPGNVLNPWKVGVPNADDVIAYTNGMGQLVIEGSGAMMDFDEQSPWSAEGVRDTLVSAEISAGVTGIGDKAFAGCSALTNVTVMANTPPTAGEGMFDDCDALEAIYVPYWSKAAYDEADGWSVHKDIIFELPPPTGSCAAPWKIGSPNADDMIAYTNGTGRLIIEGTGAMQDFEDEAPWSDCRGDITSVEIPEGVTSIGDNAFDGSGIESVTLPESLTSIGDSAFSFANLTESITIPAGVTNIGAYAFSVCAELKEVIISEGITSIAMGTFAHCFTLTKLTIPESVTEIGENAFRECHYLENVKLPSHLTNIGAEAFFYCDGQTEMTIPASVTNLGEHAFDYCYGLTNVTILATTPPTAAWTEDPDPEYRQGVFHDCDALERIYVPFGTKAAYVATEDWAPYEDIIYELPPVRDYLSFTARGGEVKIGMRAMISGVVSPGEELKILRLETATSKGGPWNDFLAGASESTVTIGDGETVYFRRKGSETALTLGTTNLFYNFTTTADAGVTVEAGGNVMSLLDQTCQQTEVGTNAFERLFSYCRNLTTAPELPATTLAPRCYAKMFEGTAITDAPELPTETLAPGCYEQMFNWCTALTNAPALPTTNLAERCYCNMFMMCSALPTAPKLPATTLAKECYFGMFAMSGVTNAPVLSAMELAESCYASMFQGCRSLTNAPALPAQELKPNCYGSMFAMCSALEKAPVMLATNLEVQSCASMFVGCSKIDYLSVDFTDWKAEEDQCTLRWLADVAETGTFVGPYELDVGVARGESTIPVGWNVVGGHVECTLPSNTVGYGYVVSNLTEGAEVEKRGEGGEGDVYWLPNEGKVGIYCVADEGYDIVGTNPYVIDPVTTDTTIDASKLPKALSWKAVWARCSTAGLPAFDPKELPSGVFYYENEILFFRRTAAGAATFDFAELDAATFAGATIQFVDGEIAVESLKFDPDYGLVFVGGEDTVLKGTVDMSVFDGVAREGAGETMPGETMWTNLAFTCEASAEIVYRNGGAISIHGGDFTIAGCVFTNCFAETFGGAIYAPKLAGDSLITNCFFEGSWVSDYNGSGGAIYASATNTACTLTVVDSTFVCNMAENGGAISTVRAAEAGEVPVRLTVAACDFGGNAADFCGGAIFAEGPVTVAGAEDGGTVDAFVSNSAGFMGGAICVGGIDSESSLVVITVGEGAAFIGNTVSNDYTWAAGGAIAVLTDGCTLDVSKALFATNRVFASADDKNAYGGAVYAPDGGTNRFYKTLFAGNELFADGCGYGGAISFATGRQTVDTCVFDCRTASAGTFVYGGALDFSSSDDVQMLNCSLRFAAVEAISAYGVGNFAVTNCVAVGNGLAGEGYDDIVCEACASVEFAYTAYGSIGGDATPTFSVTNLAACTTNIYASADSLSLNTSNYNQVAACGLKQPGVTDFTGVEYGSRPFGWSMGAYECATCDPKDAVYFVTFEEPLSVGLENYCIISNHMTGVVQEVPVMLGGEKVEITGFDSDITVTFFVNPMYQFESNSTVTVTGVRDDVVFGGEEGIPYPETKLALIAYVSVEGGVTNLEWNGTNVVAELAKRDQWTYVQFTQPVTNIYTMPDGFGFVFEKNTVFENFPSDGGLPPTLVITPPQPSEEIPEPLTFVVTRPLGENRNVRIEGDVLFDSQLPSGEQDTLVEVTGDFACTNAFQIGQLGADGRYGTPGGVSLKVNGSLVCTDEIKLIPGSTLVVTNGDLMGQVVTVPRCEVLLDGPDADGFWTYSADYIGNVTFWDDIFSDLVVSGAAVHDLWEYATMRSSEEPDYLATMLCNGETIIYGDDDGDYTFPAGTEIFFAHNEGFVTVQDGATLVARKMDVASGKYYTLEGGTIALEGGIDIDVAGGAESSTIVDLFDIGVDIRCAVNVGTGTGAGWAELWLNDVDFNGGVINLGTNGMVVCTRQLAIGSEILPVGTDVKVFEEYDTFFEEYVYSLVPDGVEEHAPFEKVVIEGSAEWAEAKAECFVVRAADDEVNSFLYQKNLVAEYQKLFTFKTKPGPEDGQCTVMAVFTDAAFASISNAVVAATAAIEADVRSQRTGVILVDTQPGLWYGVRTADTLAGLKNADAEWVLGTGTKVTLSWEVKPDAAKRFYRVEAWTSVSGD